MISIILYYLLIDIIGCVLEKSVRFGCTLHLQYFYVLLAFDSLRPTTNVDAIW
jgi:hypothetical protein